MKALNSTVLQVEFNAAKIIRFEAFRIELLPVQYFATLDFMMLRPKWIGHCSAWQNFMCDAGLLVEAIVTALAGHIVMCVVNSIRIAS